MIENATAAPASLDSLSSPMDYINSIREAFPVLSETINNHPITYFDNAATTLKPKAVIESVVEFYSRYTSNIHRGAHKLSEEASNRFEESRALVAQWLGVPINNVVFTAGTTDAIQMVANGLGLSGNDCILTTQSEHHSNILPWTKANLEFIPVNHEGRMDPDRVEQLVREHKPKLICLSYASNVTGVIHPVSQIVDIARRHGVKTLIDGAQSAPHFLLKPVEIDCDYYAFSAHKLIGPSGVGILYGKPAALEALGTPKLGGGMVQSVSEDSFLPREAPWRFESGTPNIEGVIGFGQSIEFINQLNMPVIENHLDAMKDRLIEIIQSKDHISIIGPKDKTDRTGLVSFSINSRSITVDQYTRILSDTFGIICRSGAMCAHPLFHQLSIEGGVRISPYFYNTMDELERLDQALQQMESLINQE